MRLKDKNILVTGSEGFIGSHLVELLLDMGCQIRAFVLYNSFNSWGWLDTLNRDKLDKLDIFLGDVRDVNNVRSAMKGVDIVFHLAALIGIPFSYDSPDSYVDTNIRGTLNILQAARDNKVEKVLVTSTSEVYGTAKSIPIEENHPLQAQSPYSATKIAADKISESFYRAFGLPVTIVRPFNTYGPRQSARAVIPTIITQLLAGEEEIRLGATHPTRDLVFVKDTVKGFAKIAESNETIGQEMNISTQKETSIGDLAKKIIDMINPTARVIQDKTRVRPNNSEVERLLGSCQRLKALTGWHSEYSLEDGLRETIDWFRSEQNMATYKSHIYNV